MRSIPYWELNVYSLAFQSAMNIYDLSKSWPTDEKESLVAPMLRAARQICILVAQGWQYRKRDKQQFLDKMNEATGHITEVMILLDFAAQCGYLKKSDHNQLLTNYDDVGMTLSHMIMEPDNWQ